MIDLSTSEPIWVAALLLAAYLLGAVPFGLVLVRVIKGFDVRTKGSKNIGATNVLRTAGKPLGILTLVLDALKGAAPVLYAQAAGAPTWLVATSGLVAVLGHVFPIYLLFRGGKGVATAAGVFAALTPMAMGVTFLVFLAVFLLFRIVSVGSLVASLALIGATLALDGRPIVIGLAVVVAVVVFVRHRGNLRRLLNREESGV